MRGEPLKSRDKFENWPEYHGTANGWRYSPLNQVNTKNVKHLHVALPGTPFDGHPLSIALHQVEKLTSVKPERCFVDRGYHGIKDVSMLIARQKPGVIEALRRAFKRRNAIEPTSLSNIPCAMGKGLLGIETISRRAILSILFAWRIL